MKTELNENENAWRELIALRDGILNEMPASRNDRARLRAMSEWLRRELDLETRYQAILGEAAKLVADRSARAGQAEGTNQPMAEVGSGVGAADEPEEPRRSRGKGRARQYRSAYLDRERGRGRNLTRLRSIYYKSDEGLILGITYSGEKKGTWFLNLQDGQFQEAVLLCETGAESAEVVHLPTAFFERYGRRLSQDGKGETKFNLARRNGRFFLHIPGSTGWVDVHGYVDREPLVCQHREYA